VGVILRVKICSCHFVSQQDKYIELPQNDVNESQIKNADFYQHSCQVGFCYVILNVLSNIKVADFSLLNNW
jgi:hypothetical protein